jgi:nitrate reductase (cytochrome), electron transfer subunit
MKTTPILLLTAWLAAACAASTGPASTMATGPIPDGQIGLAKGSVFDVPTPPVVTPEASSPGERPPLPRPYLIAPPRIPHAVADFLPITPKENACIDCHAVKERKPGDPTPIPPTHYTDYRNAPDRIGDRPVGARYVCVSCHVGRTDAPALVDNRFRP